LNESDFCADTPNSHNLEFVRLPPGAALRAVVECYWLARAPAMGPRPFRFLPTGCCDIVFSREGSMLDDHGLIRMVEPGIYAVGPCERFTRLQPRPGSLMFGIRLRPGAASSLLDLDVGELTGRSERIDCLSGGIRSLEMLGDWRAPGDLGRKISRVESILFKVAARRLRPDATVARALQVIEHTRGNCSVSRLASDVALGERQLGRKFAIHTGVTPKRFAQLVRFRLVRDRLLQDAFREDLAALALEAGYADQAHMTRDFRRFAGVSPNAHRRYGRVGFFQYDLMPTA
jgi:AraC-like DNA-binding protein